MNIVKWIKNVWKNLFNSNDEFEKNEIAEAKEEKKLTARQYREKYGKRLYRNALNWSRISPIQKQLRLHLINKGYRKANW